ncbi:MAG TPA: YlbF family regulator [Verrucomicrobiae bacterium]|nr:YlbF family regulator [Verrucomicrobiae bacterium]
MIVQKTRELCQTILDHPDFQAMRRSIDSFMADDSAKQEYQSLVEKSEDLNHKQQQGVHLSPEEITEYESHRERVVSNPVAAAFIRAQQEVHGIQESVNKYLSKTFELGHVPSGEELEGGGCGHGCGCHH